MKKDHGTSFKLTFEGLVPDGATGYLPNYNGYGGFNLVDMGIVTRDWFEKAGHENAGC